jgi:hypothetical protein
MAIFLALISVASADAGQSLPQRNQQAREMTAHELWNFTSSKMPREFVITDGATGSSGYLTASKRKIKISWYFEGEAPAAVLERAGHASICIRRGEDPTKCIAISIDPQSYICGFIIREINDGRSACMREKVNP